MRTFPADDLAHDVGFTPDGEHVWISSGADRRLAVHDARTLRPLRVLPGDDPPQHVTFDDGAQRVYVASGESGTLRTYRLADAQAAAYESRARSAPTTSARSTAAWSRRRSTTAG